jgi:hypothetical protein
MYRGVLTAPQQTQAADIRERLIADHLGGAPSAAQDIVLGLLGAVAAKHADAWAYLRSMPKPWVNKRSNRSWELVHDLSKLERHCAKLIEVLVNPALERRPQPVEDLTAYVARKDAEAATAAEQAAGDGALDPVPADSTPDRSGAQEQGASVGSVQSVQRGSGSS